MGNTLIEMGPLAGPLVLWIAFRVTRPKDRRRKVHYAAGHIIGVDDLETFDTDSNQLVNS